MTPQSGTGDHAAPRPQPPPSLGEVNHCCGADRPSALLQVPLKRDRWWKTFPCGSWGSGGMGVYQGVASTDAQGSGRFLPVLENTRGQGHRNRPVDEENIRRVCIAIASSR